MKLLILSLALSCVACRHIADKEGYIEYKNNEGVDSNKTMDSNITCSSFVDDVIYHELDILEHTEEFFEAQCHDIHEDEVGYFIERFYTCLK